MNILLELHYLPCVQYFSKFSIYDKIIIDDTENFQKQSYRNRCYIAGVNNILPLIIPLKKGKTHLNIPQVEIDNSRNWQREHWLSIRSAYGKSPFFEHYSHYFETFYSKEHKNLFAFNYSILIACLKILKISESTIILLSEMPKEEEFTDFRNNIHPKEPMEDSDFISNPYMQVFSDRNGFIPNLSILDLIFNEGGRINI